MPKNEFLLKKRKWSESKLKENEMGKILNMTRILTKKMNMVEILTKQLKMVKILTKKIKMTIIVIKQN